MTSRFIQIHYLTSYPAALLNRDDAGFAKRIPFGGVPRTRISSQCLKRHWRTFDGENSLAGIRDGDTAVPMSIRSRRTFEQYVFQPLVTDGVSEDVALEVTQTFMAALLGRSAQSEAKATNGEVDGAAARTGQITVLGHPEVQFILSEARAICDEVEDLKEIKPAVDARFKGAAKKNMAELRHAAGLDAALFGRMVTSDILARGDAAIHVQHAMTVHAEEAEADYFSAVDDLLRTGDDAELGSGHIGTTELTSGLYHGYVVLDVPLLVSNLEGCSRTEWEEADRGLAAEVARRLVHLVATVSPGAKLGSTAPYSYAHLVLVESGNAQPRTLANAFLAPVKQRPDVVHNTYDALARHLVQLDGMHGRQAHRRLAAIGPKELLAEAVQPEDHMTLAELAVWTAGQVGGEAT